MFKFNFELFDFFNRDAPKKKNDAKNAVGTGENDGENKEV